MSFLILLNSFISNIKWVLLIAIFLYYFKQEIKSILNRPFTVRRGDTTVSFPINQNSDEFIPNKKIVEISEEQIAEIKEDLNKTKSQIEDKDSQIFKLTLEKHFEYSYRIIFRSQIQLLQNLQALSDGYSIVQLEEYFQNIKNNYELLNNWNLDNYLKFLYDQNFIIKDQMTGKIKLSPIGDLFLKYLIVSGYNFNTEKNL